MRISSIASGSTGNCIYVGSDNTHIIIDAGVSKKRIEEGLNSFDISLNDITAILITHEHIDHINGLGVVSRKYNIPMFATPGTVQAILETKSIGNIPDGLLNSIHPDQSFSINDLDIRPFKISHDAVNPVAYRIKNHEHSLAVLTDLGKYDDYIIQNIKGVDTILIEANHDTNMLQVGKYPYYLKQRILGDKGHLSNESCGRLLTNILHDKLKNIILGHISRENNYEMLAYETVKTEISAADNPFKADDFPIHIAKYNNVLELIEV